MCSWRVLVTISGGWVRIRNCSRRLVTIVRKRLDVAQCWKPAACKRACGTGGENRRWWWGGGWRQTVKWEERLEFKPSNSKSHLKLPPFAIPGLETANRVRPVFFFNRLPHLNNASSINFFIWKVVVAYQHLLYCFAYHFSNDIKGFVNWMDSSLAGMKM